MRTIPVIFGFALLAFAGWLASRSIGVDGASDLTASSAPSRSSEPVAILPSPTQQETDDLPPANSPGGKFRASSRPTDQHRRSLSDPLADLPRHSTSGNPEAPASRDSLRTEPPLRHSVQSPDSPAPTETAVGLPPVADHFSFIAVEPNSPGNTLVHSGKKITVDGYQSTQEGNTLSTQISDLPTTPSPLRDAGFTPEEGAFRTKWGWATFSQIQSTAKAEAEETR